jgi:DNA-binding transcriptional LysR family regulator
MDIELLRTFLEVARTRHFGQAAEAMYLTQAAVSARIKALEQLLGVSLFDRVRRDIRLTPEGNRLLTRADRLISEWRKIRQEISAGGAERQLSVGGGLRLWDVLLQDWLLRMRRVRPEIALTVESHTPEVLTRRLLDGVLDLGFMLEPPQLELLQTERVADLNLVLVSSVAGQDVESALGEHYLMVDWGLAHALQHRRLFPDAPEPHTRLASGAMALGYLRELGGAAYLPPGLAERGIAAGWLHRVDDAPLFEHHVHAVYPVRSGRAELITQVLGYFRSPTAGTSTPDRGN